MSIHLTAVCAALVHAAVALTAVNIVAGSRA
jgi:hypothetical protein